MVKKLNQDMVRKLRDRRKLRPADRATLDYKMARKLQAGLDELSGLLSIMKALPPHKILPSGERKDGLKDKHVRLLFELTETALEILDFKKVFAPMGWAGEEKDLYVYEAQNIKWTGINYTTGESTYTACDHREKKPKKEDLERAKLLWEHVEKLHQRTPDVNIKSPGNPHFFPSILERHDEMKKKGML
jgi:hypothetical protein